MKIVATLFIFLICFQNLAQKDKDFTYDKESQSIVPKYLGKVILVKGNPLVRRQSGTEEGLTLGSKIYPKDTIKTTAATFVKVEMVDTTLMTAGPNTVLKFVKWKYKTKSDREATFDLVQGKIRSHFKVKAKKDNALKLKVGHVAMGVRGTRVMANYYKRQDNVTVSHVATLSGKTNIYDQVKDFEVNQKGGEQYISFLMPDGSILKSEDTPLSKKEWDYLNAPNVNPAKYFKPFLKEFNGKEISNSPDDSGKGKSAQYGPSTFSEKRAKNKPSWKNTLKKLNDRLKGSD